jgi:hypothetical protein
MSRRPGEDSASGPPTYWQVLQLLSIDCGCAHSQAISRAVNGFGQRYQKNQQQQQQNVSQQGSE